VSIKEKKLTREEFGRSGRVINIVTFNKRENGGGGECRCEIKGKREREYRKLFRMGKIFKKQTTMARGGIVGGKTRI